MKKTLAITVFMLATFAWAAAQQPGNSGQATSPSSPSAGQSQPSAPGSADQSQAPSAPVTEGCLSGSNPNYTITDKAGTTYKLNLPANADGSRLTSHVGESVQVLGDVKDRSKAGKPSIDVQRIGRGTSNCPGNGSTAAPPPKQ
jgi:uncharacterized protein YdeI (BOF family)